MLKSFMRRRKVFLLIIFDHLPLAGHKKLSPTTDWLEVSKENFPFLVILINTCNTSIVTKLPTQAVQASLYPCIIVSLYLCIFVCIFVLHYLCIFVSLYLYMFLSLYLCMVLSLHFCFSISLYLCIFIYLHISVTFYL